jgi:hypothetical protein
MALSYLRSPACLSSAPLAGSADQCDRVLARLQQLSFGKNTLGYDVYRLRGKRRREDPPAPLATDDRPKRGFDDAVKSWRRSLHKHFPAGSGAPAAGACGGGAPGAGAAVPARDNTVLYLANGDGNEKEKEACARVLGASHSGEGGGLPLLLLVAYGQSRPGEVGQAAARAAAGRVVWERAAEEPCPPAHPAPQLLLQLQRAGARDLAPGPRGPAAGFTEPDYALVPPQLPSEAWGLGAADTSQDPQHVQALTQRVLAFEPTHKRGGAKTKTRT